MKFLLTVFVLWLSFASVAYSTDGIDFNIKALKIGSTRLNNIRLRLANIRQSEQILTLQADQLTLPAPFAEINIVNLTCEQLLWQQQAIQCHKGRAEIKLPELNIQMQNFNFQLAAENSQFQMQQVKFAGGMMELNATEAKGVWQVTLKSKNLSLAKLQTILKQSAFKVKKGSSSMELTLKGQANNVQIINARLVTQDLTLDTPSGLIAAENLHLESFLTAQCQQENWFWQNHTAMQKGALYVDPLYLTTTSESIELDSLGTWQTKENLYRVDYAQWLHPKVGNVNATGKIQPTLATWLSEATLNLTTLNLSSLGKTYLQPFLLGTAYDGIDLSGKLQTQISLQHMNVEAFHVDAQQLTLKDPKKRFGLSNLNADIQWSRQVGFNKAGQLSWQQLLVYTLPLEAAKLDLHITEQQISLTRPVSIGFLGGQFAVQNFSWQSRKAQAPEVHFAGALQDVSLDQLTSVLKWTPLTGKVSGLIPSVRYKKNRLDLDGAINIQVFDGKITLDNLAVANLLSDVPKFYSDIDIENLNLSQVTEKFQFGGIQGLLSGYINDLYLENWRPISFYAWLGTPKDDKSPHRVSQKAVDNIANIGGNGATDLISRGLMGMFDSFGYDELGMGCYLHNGTCQLMGVTAAANGYYLIKGSGLPRIDVVGYNPKVDWKVLVQRLGRLSSTENMVID